MNILIRRKSTARQKLTTIYNNFKNHRINFLKERNTLKGFVARCSLVELNTALQDAEKRNQKYLSSLILKELNARG